MATTYNNIAVVYCNKGDYDTALQYHDKARKIRESVLDENHSALATTYGNIGMVYVNRSDYNTALE